MQKTKSEKKELKKENIPSQAEQYILDQLKNDEQSFDENKFFEEMQKTQQTDEYKQKYNKMSNIGDIYMGQNRNPLTVYDQMIGINEQMKTQWVGWVQDCPPYQKRAKQKYVEQHGWHDDNPPYELFQRAEEIEKTFPLVHGWHGNLPPYQEYKEPNYSVHDFIDFEELLGDKVAQSQNENKEPSLNKNQGQNNLQNYEDMQDVPTVDEMKEMYLQEEMGCPFQQ